MKRKESALWGTGPNRQDLVEKTREPAGVKMSPCHRHCSWRSQWSRWGSEKIQVEKEPALDIHKPRKHQPFINVFYNSALSLIALAPDGPAN